MSLGQVGGQADRLEVGRPGLCETLKGPQNIAQVVVQARHVRLQPNRLFAMRQRVERLPAVEQKLAEVALRRRMSGIDPDGILKVRECLVEVSELTFQIAQIAVRGREVGAQAQRLTKLRGGLVANAHRLQGQTEIGNRLGKIGA
jgi:hypothetical protein